MFRRGMLLLAVCLSLTAAANAGEVLDSLIQTALKNNPDIQAAEFQKASADYRAEAAGVLPDPQLSLATMNLPWKSLALDETPMSAVVVGFSQAIPWPSKLGSRGKIAHFQSAMDSLDVTARRNNIVRMVTDGYYEYSYWCLADSILDENIALIGSIIDIAETGYSNGMRSATDVLRAQTAQSRMQNRKLDIDRMQRSALALLTTLTGETPRADYELTPALPENIAAIDISNTGSAVSQNPDLLRAGVKTDMFGEKLSLAKKDYWPDLMVGVDYSFRKDQPMDAVHGEDYLSFKLGLKLPLWFFKNQKNQTRAAQQNLASARADRQAVDLKIEKQIFDVRLALNAAAKQLDNYHNDILPQARAALEVAQTAYETGKGDFNDLLSVQMDLLNIDLERLTLLKSYHQNTARYRELIGLGYRDGR